MVVGHGTISSVEEMDISDFEATCLAVLARVVRTGNPVLVTRFGQPVAQVSPPPRQTGPRVLRDERAILGDLIEPVSSLEDWEVLADGPEVGRQRSDR